MFMFFETSRYSPDGADLHMVGWLARGHPFQSGQASTEMFEALFALLFTHRVNQFRGFHICEFCKPTMKILRVSGRDIPIPEPCIEERSGRALRLGSAEIWVPSVDGKIVYAAPDLIYHYVVKHNYAPPDGFVAAVLQTATGSGLWNARDEFTKRVR
jgi:hypothetical protein